MDGKPVEGNVTPDPVFSGAVSSAPIAPRSVHRAPPAALVTPSRRVLLRRALALAGLGLFGHGLTGCRFGDEPAAKRWAGRHLVVVTDGGAARLALWNAVFVPFERETGCVVMEVDRRDRDAVPDLRRQALTGQVQWDLVPLEAVRVPALAAEGFLEPIDYTLVPRDDIRPGLALDHGAGFLADTLALAYRVEPYAGREPEGWAAVWDTAAYPGPRACPHDGIGLLEAALLADGVPADRLYPLDLDRAFRALDRLRPAVSVWWRKSDRPRQAIEQGEVDLAAARGGELRAAITNGAAARIAPVPTPLVPLCWAIPHGAPNRDVAHDFIAYTLRPRAQDKLAAVGYLPARASSTVSPPAHTFPPDLNWWAAHGRLAAERFAEWVSR